MLGGFQIGRSALLTSAGHAGHGSELGQRGHHWVPASNGGTPLRLVREIVFSGQGVGVSSIRRELDPALAARLRGALSMEVANGTEYTYLSQVEALQDALGDNNLSTELTAFFGVFSNLADNLSDDALRVFMVVSWYAWLIVSTVCMSITLNARTNLDADLSASADKSINC